MKKVILGLALFGIMVNVYAGCGGCRDEGLAKQLGEASSKKFDKLDKDTEKKINEIVKKINKANQDLEVQNKDILIQNQKLLTLQAITEKEILFNQTIITRLQSIVNEKDATKGFFEK